MTTAPMRSFTERIMERMSPWDFGSSPADVEAHAVQGAHDDVRLTGGANFNDAIRLIIL
jgi:hypothetical protein